MSVRAWASAGAVALVAGLVAAVPAVGAKECDGLQVCVPVAGPWVVVPVARGAQRPKVEFQLSCPRRHTAGGLDAELSQRAIDLHFLGTLGSPVNPGISTAQAVVFVGSYVGENPRGPTFKPYVGCIPSAGGGGRIPTSVRSFPPGQPTTRRVRNVRVGPGTATVAQGCRRGERLVGAAHAFAFDTRNAPSRSLVSSVSGRRSIRAGRVVLRVTGDAEVQGARALVQVQAVCSRER